jgi:hypothetical protein
MNLGSDDYCKGLRHGSTQRKGDTRLLKSFSEQGAVESHHQVLDRGAKVDSANK